MGTVRNLMEKLQRLDISKLATDSIEETKDYYVEQNHEQMMNGKRSDGQDITPSYFEDPFFKTYAQALRYSDWKDRIEPFRTKRRPGTPNLYINGYFHNSLSVRVDQSGVTFDSSWSEHNAIEQKYSRKIYGLGGEWRDNYLNDNYAGLRTAWKKRMEVATGLKLVR